MTTKDNNGKTVSHQDNHATNVNDNHHDNHDIQKDNIQKDNTQKDNTQKDNKKKNGEFQRFYDYYMEYVAIQFRRLTQGLFMLICCLVFLLWQGQFITPSTAASLMMVMVLLVFMLSASFLWRDNSLVYWLYQRRTGDVDKDVKQEDEITNHDDVGYPFLYRTCAYILACRAVSYTGAMESMMKKMHWWERYLFRCLF